MRDMREDTAFDGVMTAGVIRIIGPGILQAVTRSDLVPEFRDPISRGWRVAEDAVLPRSWYESY
jgi:hypothetical protein